MATLADRQRYYQGDITNNPEFDAYWNMFGDPPDDANWWNSSQADEWFTNAMNAGNQQKDAQAAADKGSKLKDLLALAGVVYGGGSLAGLWGGAGAAGAGAGITSADMAAGMVPEFGTHAGMAAGMGAGAAPNVWQSVADMGPLAGPMQAPEYTLGDSNFWNDLGSSWEGAAATTADQNATLAALTGTGGATSILDKVGNFLGKVSPNTWMNLGGQALNAYMGYRGASQAADAMRDVSSQNQAALAPWLQAGSGALNTLTGRMPDLTRRFTMSDFEQDPGYAFRLAEGQKALERSAAARGGLFSGGTGKALTRYGQDMGSQEYTNAYNRYMGGNQNEYNMLSNIAGLGQTATGQLINQNTQLGNVNAATEMAKANALTGGVNNFLNSQNRYSIYDDIFGRRRG